MKQPFFCVLYFPLSLQYAANQCNKMAELWRSEKISKNNWILTQPLCVSRLDRWSIWYQSLVPVVFVDLWASQFKSGKLVFYTSGDKPLIRTTCQINKDGSSKYSNINLVTSRFCKLMKKASIRALKGTGFYTLRRTAATVAARSGDPSAVQRLLGHANLKMATRYVQDVSKQTDRVIENSRKYVI